MLVQKSLRGRKKNAEAAASSKPATRRHRTILECSYCSSSFSKREHLIRHERSHTKERPFECALCKKHFSRYDTLSRHQNTLHKTARIDDSIDEIYLSVNPARQPDIHIPREPPVNESTDEFPNEGPWASSDLSHPQDWWLEDTLNLESVDLSLFGAPGNDNLWLQDQIGSFPETSNPRPYVMDDLVQKSWYTYIEDTELPPSSRRGDTPSQEVSLDSGDIFDLGPSFRARASQHLTTQPNLDPLPTTEFLNSCMRSYFTHFTALFPIIHVHTFRPSKDNSLVVLMISSIGSLLLGGVGITWGIRMFEKFNKAILASWESTMLASPAAAVNLVQAAFLSQLFGLLSGVPRHLAIVEAFQGTIISWARRCNIFNHKPLWDDNDLALTEGNTLLETWKSWAKGESILRTLHGIYIIDSQLASMFHHDALLRHDSLDSNAASDDDVFEAPTATVWKARMMQRKSRDIKLGNCLHNNLSSHSPSSPTPDELLCQHSRFTAYFALRSISVKVSELQMQGHLEYGSEKFTEMYNSLICWYNTFQPSHRAFDPFGLLILWHATFLELLTNFDHLERALGRDGPQANIDSDLMYAAGWAKSISGDHSILHARAIQASLIQSPLSANPAIHIPHCAFLAGVACYSAMNFRRHRFASPQPSVPRSPADFPEFGLGSGWTAEHLLTKEPILFQNATGEQLMRTVDQPRAVWHVGVDIFRNCVDVLDRIGHCGNARAYGKTLTALITPEIER